MHFRPRCVLCGVGVYSFGMTIPLVVIEALFPFPKYFWMQEYIILECKSWQRAFTVRPYPSWGCYNVKTTYRMT